jgi:beta-glucosidase-like glycosyl hydrolase
VPADLSSADEARAEATETATTLRGLNLTGVLGPVVDVGFESGSALGARVYSDDPQEVAGYADAVIHAYSVDRLFSAA